jgi:hypothetical protein
MLDEPLRLSAEHLDRLSGAAREHPSGLPLLHAAEAIGRAETGHGLCTAMLFDAGRMTVRRLYSSNPAAYPVGGEKPKRDTPWGQQVLLEQRIFLGEGEAAIRQHFDDHAVIFGLGLRSIVNVPVLSGGQCLGTLNFLWRSTEVRPGWLALARWLTLVATPDWMRQSAPL